MTADDFKAISKGLIAHLSDGHVGEADDEHLTPPCFLILHEEDYLLGPIKYALKEVVMAELLVR